MSSVTNDFPRTGITFSVLSIDGNEFYLGKYVSDFEDIPEELQALCEEDTVVESTWYHYDGFNPEMSGVESDPATDDELDYIKDNWNQVEQNSTLLESRRIEVEEE